MPFSHEGSRAHVELIEGRARLPRIGEVACGPGSVLPWLVRDGAGCEVEAVSGYLRDRMLGDISPLTCRSCAYDLLRGHDWRQAAGQFGRFVYWVQRYGLLLPPSINGAAEAVFLVQGYCALFPALLELGFLDLAGRGEP